MWLKHPLKGQGGDYDHRFAYNNSFVLAGSQRSLLPWPWPGSVAIFVCCLRIRSAPASFFAHSLLAMAFQLAAVVLACLGLTVESAVSLKGKMEVSLDAKLCVRLLMNGGQVLFMPTPSVHRQPWSL